MKIVNVILRIKEGRAEEFKAGVRKTTPILEKVDGTLAFLITQSDSDPHEFRFFEVYRDEAAFQEHMRVATSELEGRELMEELVVGPWRPFFGQLVAGGARLTGDL